MSQSLPSGTNKPIRQETLAHLARWSYALPASLLFPPVLHFAELFRYTNSKDELIEALYRVYELHQQKDVILESIVNHEVAVAGVPAELFIRESFTGRLLSRFLFNTYGKSFLKKVINPIVQYLQSCKNAPLSKSNSSQALKVDQPATDHILAIENMLATLKKNAVLCPLHIRQTLLSLMEQAERKWNNELAYSVVKSVFLKRFIIPAIAEPSTYGLADEPFDSVQTEQLTDVLQKLVVVNSLEGNEVADRSIAAVKSFSETLKMIIMSLVDTQDIAKAKRVASVAAQCTVIPKSEKKAALQAISSLVEWHTVQLVLKDDSGSLNAVNYTALCDETTPHVKKRKRSHSIRVMPVTESEEPHLLVPKSASCNSIQTASTKPKKKKRIKSQIYTKSDTDTSKSDIDLAQKSQSAPVCDTQRVKKVSFDDTVNIVPLNDPTTETKKKKKKRTSRPKSEVVKSTSQPTPKSKLPKLKPPSDEKNFD